MAWGNYGTCCNAYDFDFGKINDAENVENFGKEIFNSESYIRMRADLVEGTLNHDCERCTHRNYGAGSIHQVVNLYTNMLIKIDDIGQRKRARDNFALAIEAAVMGKTEVEHSPCFLNICCGSVCNIRCKFCYNCLMDYDPDPNDIIKVIDILHKKLIFVHLTGGEVLVTRSGRALLKRFAEEKYKFAVSLGTNAQWTDFDLLRPVNLCEVQISSDGATKEVYEKVRIGGNFEDLLGNIRKFVDLKKEKPNLLIRLNYTVTSDNYMDIPEAVKLYEDFGLFVTFNLVMREKDDPQNIRERPDLYDGLLKNIELGMANSQNEFTKDTLRNVKMTIEDKMKENVSPLQ